MQPDKVPSGPWQEEGWHQDVTSNIIRYPCFIRAHLDSGVLAALIKKHTPETRREAWTEKHKKVALLAYCAMELGCKLPPGFQSLLKVKCFDLDLPVVGYHQLYRACDEYIDGKPFSFSSLDTRRIEEDALKEETTEIQNLLAEKPPRRPPIPPGLEPLPSQEAAAATEQPSLKRRIVEGEASLLFPFAEWFLRFPSDTCANCGSDRGHGTPELRRCRGCKTTLYCFEGCQRWHLSRGRHKCEVEQDDEDDEESSPGVN